MSGWIKYEPGRTHSGLRGQVSVCKGGMTIARDLAHHLTGQKNIDKKAVEIYSTQDGLIGLRPGRDGYSPRKTDSGALNISCRGAVKHLPIPHGVYAAKWDESGEMLIFNTREGGP